MGTFQTIACSAKRQNRQCLWLSAWVAATVNLHRWWRQTNHGKKTIHQQGDTMLTVSPADLEFIGNDIERGECILATKSGDLFLPDRRGGVNIVRPDGRTERILAQGAPEGFMPNGIALLPDRSFLMADLGPGGGVYHMTRDGKIKPHLLEVDGHRLEPTNFVGIDSKSRTWISVSTRMVPREQSMKKGHADGYLILMDQRGARIVAEGFGF